VYFGDTFCPPPRERVVLDFSTPHRVPLTWLAHHGSEAIRLRAARELAPLGYEADLDALTRPDEAAWDQARQPHLIY